MENPSKMDDLGVLPIFGNTHIYIYTMDAQHLRFYETVLSHVRVMLITSLVET